MKIVSVHPSLLKRYEKDPQVLRKNGRPCVLVIRLKYKGKHQSFAVPLRSNIPPAAPKSQYFPLPPRPTTKPKHRHGVHYIKMVPIEKKYQTRYRTEGNEFSTMISKILHDNQKQVINECQSYLSQYENGEKPPFSTDIDLLLSLLFSPSDDC